MNERDSGNARRRALVLIPVAIFLISMLAPMVATNVAAAPMVSFYCDKQYILPTQAVTITATWSGVYAKAGCNDPNVEIDKDGVGWPPYYYSGTNGGSGSTVRTIPANTLTIGTHVITMWYATGWLRLYQTYNMVWQQMNIYVLDPNADLDGDGLTNYQEIMTYHTDPAGYKKWAIVVDGGAIDCDGRADFDKGIVNAYITLLHKGYSDYSICLLTPYTAFDADKDGVSDDQDYYATSDNLYFKAFGPWLNSRSDRDDQVLFLISDHGSPIGEIMLAGGTAVYASAIRSHMDHDSTSNRIISLIDACYSGLWVGALSGTNKLVMTCTDSGSTSWNGWSNEVFLICDLAGYHLDVGNDPSHSAYAYSKETWTKSQINDQIPGYVYL